MESSGESLRENEILYENAVAAKAEGAACDFGRMLAPLSCVVHEIAVVLAQLALDAAVEDFDGRKGFAKNLTQNIWVQLMNISHEITIDGPCLGSRAIMHQILPSVDPLMPPKCVIGVPRLLWVNCQPSMIRHSVELSMEV